MELARFLKTAPSKAVRPLLAVLGLAAALMLSYTRTFDRYELQTYDWRFQLRGPRPVHPDIVHIDIWNDTLESIGVWPFDRKYHAQLIHDLQACGAKAIIFDVLFSEPHPSDPKVVEAAASAKNVYFAMSFSDLKSAPGRVFAERIDSDAVPSYKEVAKAVGFVNTKADLDGKRRRVMPVISYWPKTPGKARDYRGAWYRDINTRDYYQLSFQALFDLLGVKREDIVFRPGKSLQLSKDLVIPLDEDGCLIIDFAGLWESTFPHYSYLDVLSSYQSVQEGEKPVIDLKKLKGKICVIGMTAQGSIDVSPVTVQSIYPLVGTHSNILNTVLMKDFIRRLGRAANLLILVLISLCTAWVSFYKKPAVSFVYVLATLTIFMAVVIDVFIYAGIWADLFYPAAVIVMVYAVGTLTRIMREMRKRELIESELKIASQIQQSFLPAAPPALKGLSVAVFMRPAKAVGGDLYAFVPLGPDRVGVMVGDVSGKGTPAALFMGKVVSEFKYAARDRSDPAQVLSLLNDAIASEATGGLFVTLTYVIFDLKARKLLLSNAGHLPLVVARADKRAEQLTAEGGMPIGVMEGVEFLNRESPLSVGECYAFYSDGISEARNRKKDEYGVESLEKALLRHRAPTAEQVLNGTVEEVTRFIGKAEQHDDMTLIVAQITETS